MKRFHLSTLLLLSVLAAAFLGSNAQIREISRVRGGWRNGDFVVYHRGWPCTFHESIVAEMRHVSGRTLSAIEEERMDQWGITVNLAVGLGTLALIGYVSENIIRRRQTEGEEAS